VHELLNASDLECQHGIFKLTMKSNVANCLAPPFDTNPLTRMWHLVTTFHILITSFLEYVKMAELAMV
jgi:hypothetical protein